MTHRTGMAERIAAYVAAHPGCTRAEMLAGCGMRKLNDAMPAYCQRKGRIFAAGPRGSYRYFPSAEQAAAAHAAIVAEVKARRQAKKQFYWTLDNLRKRAKRHAQGGRNRNTRPGLHKVHLEPGVRLAPDVRITIAPPMRSRW